MAFWRRSKGRHALGAAVTSIPAAPPRLVLPSPLPAAPTTAGAVTTPSWSFPEPATVAEPVPVGPRVELTFRDGSSAALDPVQARALDEIAQVLTRRD